MYEIYSAKRFLWLLALDVVIFSVCSVFFLIAKEMFFSSAQEKNNEAPVPLPVIMYHSVYDGQPSEYIVTPDQLENDLKWLKSNGYTSVSAKELIDYTQNNGELPEKPVLITLDDGHYNNLSVLLPLLEKYDMCAVVSVVGSYTEKLAYNDSHTDKYSYLTWEDISALIDSGRIEIGNHTYDMHSFNGARKGCSKLSGENEEEYHDILMSDLTLLQNEIKNKTGISPYVFAYPFGYISRESLPVIRECGFLVTLTCYEKMNYITRDPDSLLGLNRYNRSGFYSTEEYMRILTHEKEE